LKEYETLLDYIPICFCKKKKKNWFGTAGDQQKNSKKIIPSTVLI